jgi:L-methionine (R)-S-oxide reductase
MSPENMPERDKELGHLHDLAELLTTEEDLEGHFGEVARLAAEAIGAATCSVMLLAEGDRAPRLKLWASTEQLPEEAWKDEGGIVETIAGLVLFSGEPVLIDDISHSQYAGLARSRPDLGKSCIVVPVPVGGEPIGVMSLTSRPARRAFTANDLTIARIVATLIGKSVQVVRLQTLVRSRVAQLTLARQEKEVALSLTNGSLPPARLAKMLAKAFYKDLAAAGFNAGQIVEAASEIIAQISTDVVRHKTRITREQSKSEK